MSDLFDSSSGNSDDDDNIPIFTLVRKRRAEASTAKHERRDKKRIKKRQTQHDVSGNNSSHSNDGGLSGGDAIEELYAEQNFVDSDEEDDYEENEKVGRKRRKKKGAASEHAPTRRQKQQQQQRRGGKPKDDRKYNQSLSQNGGNPAATLLVLDQVFGNLDILSTLFSFLGVRELFCLAMTCKPYMELLTYEHVVRSSMLSGGHVKTSIENLVGLLKEPRKIWVPSPLRMLRLVNGKRCEHCNEHKVNQVSKRFGVFYCSTDCLRVGFNQRHGGFAKSMGRNRKWAAFLEHPRMATIDCSNNAFVWTVPVVDTYGIPYGPLVTKRHMEEILEQKGDEFVKMEHDEKRAAIQAIVDAADAKDPRADANAQAIIKAYNNCVEEANGRVQEAKDKKKEANEKANQARITKTVAWIQQLTSLVGDDVPWMDAVNTYHFVCVGAKEVAKFTCPWVDDLLRPFSWAPSKATKKALQQAADTLRETFDLVWSKGLHDFSFLKESNHALEKCLWQHFSSLSPANTPCIHMRLAPNFLRNLKTHDGLVELVDRMCPDQVRTAVVAGLLNALRDDDEEDDDDLEEQFQQDPSKVDHVKRALEGRWSLIRYQYGSVRRRFEELEGIASEVCHSSLQHLASRRAILAAADENNQNNNNNNQWIHQAQHFGPPGESDSEEAQF